jgi:hypothetical protein
VRSVQRAKMRHLVLRQHSLICGLYFNKQSSIYSHRHKGQTASYLVDAGK